MKNIKILVLAVITIIILLVIVWVGMTFGAEGLFLMFFVGPLAISIVALLYWVVYTILEKPIEWFFKNMKRW